MSSHREGSFGALIYPRWVLVAGLREEDLFMRGAPSGTLEYTFSLRAEPPGPGFHLTISRRILGPRNGPGYPGSYWADKMNQAIFNVDPQTFRNRSDWTV